MGIDLYCENITFGSSYSHWNEIRINIIEATQDYIIDMIKHNTEMYGNLTADDEKYIGDGSEYNYNMNKILELFTITLKKNPENNMFGFKRDYTIQTFIKLCHNYDYMNSLNNFDIGGLYSINNQSDCEGYYTPGNSLDICVLFDKIKPFVEKYSCYDCIYKKEGRMFNSIYEVFEHSHKTLISVKIC